MEKNRGCINRGGKYLAIGLIVSALIAGCSGGGSSSSGSTGGAPIVSGKVTLSGTVASGLPFSNQPVSIRDKNGTTASATTLADGTYSAELTNMTAPYLIKVGSLYSVATATASGTANVHPFTDMIVRNWYKVQGSHVDTAFNATGAMPTPPTATDIATIEATVRQVLTTYMKGADVNPSGFNLITTPFNANHTGFDLVLDNLKVTQPATSGGNVTIGLTGGGSTGTILTIPETTDLTTITPPPAPLSDTVAPSAAGAITASRTGTTQVVLSWAAASDNIQVAGYKIYQNGTQVGITDQPFYIDGAAPAASACYTVAAYDAAGNSSAQNTQVCASSTVVAADITAPTKPGLTAVASSSSQIDLSWTASTDAGGIAGYRVMVGGAAIATLPANATSYSHTGLNASTQYGYTVVAIDTSGNATSSATASATTSAKTDTTAPTAPSGVTATAASATRIDLAWTASIDTVGVAGYKVDSGTTLVGTSATASYSAVNLTAGTQYCYTVKAYDAAGNLSDASAETCATTQAASSLAQLMAGSWWEHNNDDGKRQDLTLDDYGNEVNGPATIIVDANGTWTYSVTDPAGQVSISYPATAVTESGNTVTLMDADGLGRTLLTYDAASKSIKGQWQKKAPDGTFWANYETWTGTNQLVDTWISTSGNGTTYTYYGDGSYTGWVAGGSGYEQGTYTWNSSTGAFMGNDLTHNALSQSSVVTVSGDTLTINFNGTPYTFNRASKPSSIVGSWTLPVQPDGTGGTNLVLTFFANGDYMQSQSVTTAASTTPGLEHGTYTWNSATGSFTATCPTIDTNLQAGFSAPAGVQCAAGTTVMNATANVNGNTMTLGTMTFTRVINVTTPIVGSWSGAGDTNMVFTFFANGDYMQSQSVAIGPGVQPGLEHGTYTWNSSTGALAAACPTVDTNLQAGFSSPNATDCTPGTTSASYGTTMVVSGNTMKFDWIEFGVPQTMTLARVTNVDSMIDLNGTWNKHRLQAGRTTTDITTGTITSITNNWSYGVDTWDASGNFAETSGASSGGGAYTLGSGTMSISADGTVTDLADPSFHGTISASKDLVVVTRNAGNGIDPRMVIFQKQNPAITFSAADFAGTWDRHMIRAGRTFTDIATGAITSTTNKWERGVETWDASGNMVEVSGAWSEAGAYVLFSGTGQVISASGIITDPAVPTLYGVMSASKDLVVTTKTAGNGIDVVMSVFQKRNPAVTFTAADLAGIWNRHRLQAGRTFTDITTGTITSTTNNWNHGVDTVDGSGNVTPGPELSSDGNTTPGTPSTWSVSADGIITDSTDPTFHATMSASKDLIVGTRTAGNGIDVRLVIYQRK